MIGLSSQILEITTVYPGLPDVRTMSIKHVRFFYDALMPGLIEQYKRDQELKKRNGR